MTDDRYEDRVGRGAALLDRVRPGWAGEIATDRLAMQTGDECILGQLYGEYTEGWVSIDEYLLINDTDFGRFFPSEFGFTLTFRDKDNSRYKNLDCFPRLADAWRAEIRRRATPPGGPT